MKVKISATGSYAPEKVLSNADLSKMVETSDEWIVQRTGIKERRMAREDECPSDLALIASQRALESIDIKPEEIDLIVCATSFPDYAFPSTGCLLQKKLGAVNAGAYDVSAGCTGFVYALSTGTQFVRSGRYNNVLIVGTETLSKITNWKDRSTCILFGDGAGAALLQPSDDDSDILYTELGADGSQYEHVILPSSGAVEPPNKVEDKSHLCISMNGRAVYKFAVNKMAELAIRAVEKSGVSLDDVSIIVPHQVNLRIIESALERLDFPMDRCYININKYGNTSSASIPVAFDEAIKEGKVRRGDLVLMMAFGAGLTWGSVLFKW